MNNIDDLQRRIMAAMDRMAKGLDQIDTSPSGPDPETLQALEDERTANAQLSERVRVLKTTTDAEKARLEVKIAEGEARMAQLDIELLRLRYANEQMAEACAALRAANSEGVGEPHLINKAILAELDGLRAARAADVAESSAILAALSPLLESANKTDAPQEEMN